MKTSTTNSLTRSSKNWKTSRRALKRSRTRPKSTTKKSEKWQEGDNGQLMDEKIGEMDVGIEDLEALIEKLNDIAGD